MVQNKLSLMPRVTFANKDFEALKNDVIKNRGSVISRSPAFPPVTLSNLEYYFMRPISQDPSGFFVKDLTALFCKITGRVLSLQLD